MEQFRKDLLKLIKQNSSLPFLYEDNQTHFFKDLLSLITDMKKSCSYLPGSIVTIPAASDIATIAKILTCLICRANVFIYNPKIPNLNLEISSYLEGLTSCILIRTSGTTSNPKLAVLSLENIFYSAIGTNNFFSLKTQDVWQLSLPIYHVGGLLIIFRALIAGSSIFISKDLPIHEKATIVSFVPTQHLRFLKQRVSCFNLRAILLGGALITEELTKASKQLPIYGSYGMTEMCAQITCGKMSLGSTLKYRQLKLDQTNEILVKGKTLFLGYVSNQGLHKPLDSDGWFHSSDIGKMTDQGLQIIGRKDRQFISGGENIQPEEIEKALLSLEDVIAAKVTPIEDEEYGMRPIAYITCLSPFKEKTIKAKLKEQLPSFKVPDRIFPFKLPDFK